METTEPEVLTLEEAKQSLLDGNLINPKDPTDLEAGLVLLGGLVVGTRSKDVARWMGVRTCRVQRYARNLRRHGVWRIDGKTYAAWDETPQGVLAFVCDLLVAKGLVAREPTDGFVYNPRGRRPQNAAREARDGDQSNAD